MTRDRHLLPPAGSCRGYVAGHSTPSQAPTSWIANQPYGYDYHEPLPRRRTRLTLRSARDAIIVVVSSVSPGFAAPWLATGRCAWLVRSRDGPWWWPCSRSKSQPHPGPGLMSFGPSALLPWQILAALVIGWFVLVPDGLISKIVGHRWLSLPGRDLSYGIYL